MKITVTLDIPEEAVYAGVVADALEKIAPAWDEGARSGDLTMALGQVSWDSSATESTENAW